MRYTLTLFCNLDFESAIVLQRRGKETSGMKQHSVKLAT